MLPAMSPKSPKSPPPGEAAAERRSGPFHGIQGLMLTITLFASLAILTLPFLRPDGGRRTPLRIVVAEPELSGSGVDLRRQQLLLEAVRDSLERQLYGRRGVLPARLFAPAARALEIAREAEADEVLWTRIKVTPFGAPYAALLSMGRRRSIDGNLVWQRDEAQIAVDDLRRVDRQIGDQLLLAYVRYERPAEAAQLFAEAADYETFLRLRLELQSAAGGGAAEGLLPQFARLRASSPRFFEAYLWPGRALAAAPGGGREDEALMLLEQASRIAPADPRPAEAAFQLLLALGRHAAAEQQLAVLERLRAGDPLLANWRSLLESRRRQAEPRRALPAEDRAGGNVPPADPR